jgi:hypothetical protein
MSETKGATVIFKCETDDGVRRLLDGSLLKDLAVLVPLPNPKKGKKK